MKTFDPSPLFPEEVKQSMLTTPNGHFFINDFVLPDMTNEEYQKTLAPIFQFAEEYKLIIQIERSRHGTSYNWFAAKPAVRYTT